MNKAKYVKVGITVLVASAFIAGSAVAGDQIRSKDRKKDSSCQSYVMTGNTGIVLAAAQTRTRDRAQSKESSQSGDRVQTRDRKKDGSCLIAG